MNANAAEDTTVPALPTPGELLEGRFEIRASLGEGGMGHVFRAYDRQRAVDVAIKLIVPRYLGRADREERFLREFELGRRVQDHPHLVQMLDGGRLRETGWPFLVMALVEGKALSHRLALGSLPPHVAARVARQIAGAVRALHRGGVVHRDIRPMNVLLRGQEAVLIDLSHAGDAAAPRLAAGHTRRLTRENEVPGTHQYMSPEQARAEPAQLAMDVYAFGVTLAQLLVGLTLDPHSREAYLQLQREGKIKPPRVDIRIHTTVPRRLADLVDACTAMDPSERPTSDDLVRRLDEVLAAMTMPADVSGPAVAARPPVVGEGDMASGEGTVSAAITERQDVGMQRTPISVPSPIDGGRTVEHGETDSFEEEPQGAEGSWRLVVVTALLVIVVVVVVGLMAWWWTTRPEAEPEFDGHSDADDLRTNALEPPTRTPDSGVEILPGGAREEAAGDAGALIPPPGSQQPPESGPQEEEVGEPSRAETRPKARRKAKSRRKGRGQPKGAPAASVPPVGEGPQPAETEDCIAQRADADRAAASASWSKVAKLTRRRECWSKQGDRKRLRVRALFETQSWKACVDEGRGVNEPQVKQWVDLCQRHVD